MVDKDKIKKIITQHFVIHGAYVIDDDGQVAVNGLVGAKQSMARLPVKFSRIDGDVNMSNIHLESFANFPSVIGGSLNLENNEIRNCVGMPEVIDGWLDISKNPLENLNGFSKTIGGFVDITYTPTLPLLRLLVAPEVVLRMPRNFSGSWLEMTETRDRVEKILDKYVGHGRAAVIDCKRELVAAGFEGNARW